MCCSGWSQKHWDEQLHSPQKPLCTADSREQWLLCAAAARRNRTSTFPSMHPMAVLNSMFPLSHPAWREQGLFWEIGSRRARNPLGSNKGHERASDGHRTPGKWSVPAVPCAVCINTGPCLPFFFFFLRFQSSTCQARHSLIKLVNTLSSPRLPTGVEGNHRRMHPRPPIPAAHPGSPSYLCALFLPCHTANLSITGNTALSYYLWELAFCDAAQAGIPIELSRLPAPRSSSRAEHLHCCSPGRVLSPSWGSVGVIYSPFKQTPRKHCMRLFCESLIFPQLKRGADQKSPPVFLVLSFAAITPC